MNYVAEQRRSPVGAKCYDRPLSFAAYPCGGGAGGSDRTSHGGRGRCPRVVRCPQFKTIRIHDQGRLMVRDLPSRGRPTTLEWVRRRFVARATRTPTGPPAPTRDLSRPSAPRVREAHRDTSRTGRRDLRPPRHRPGHQRKIEGTNNKLGILKRVAYGFTNLNNLAARALLLIPGMRASP